MRTTLSIVKKLFPWRSCTKAITGTDPRPCLDYYINRCIAPCTAYCTKEEYDEVIDQTILFLEGKTNEVVTSLKKQMERRVRGAASSSARRCSATRSRPSRTWREKQFVERIRPTDEDVFGLARAGTDEASEACVQVLLHPRHPDGGPRLLHAGRRAGRDGRDVLGSFLKQFYESAVYIPKKVVVPFAVPEASLIEEWLTEKRGSKVDDRRGPAGRRRRRLTELATRERERVARHAARALAGRHEEADDALTQLQEELDLPSYPRRIECYDNSNIQGTSPVASMVVFIDGKPADGRVPALQDQDGRGRQRLRVDGRDPRPPLQALGEQPGRRRASRVRRGLGGGV